MPVPQAVSRTEMSFCFGSRATRLSAYGSNNSGPRVSFVILGDGPNKRCACFQHFGRLRVLCAKSSRALVTLRHSPMVAATRLLVSSRITSSRFDISWTSDPIFSDCSGVSFNCCRKCSRMRSPNCIECRAKSLARVLCGSPRCAKPNVPAGPPPKNCARFWKILIKIIWQRSLPRRVVAGAHAQV